MKKNQENLKKDEIKNYVIANNDNCLNEMKVKAEKMGYTVSVMHIFGDIKKVVTEILEKNLKE